MDIEVVSKEEISPSPGRTGVTKEIFDALDGVGENECIRIATPPNIKAFRICVCQGSRHRGLRVSVRVRGDYAYISKEKS